MISVKSEPVKLWRKLSGAERDFVYTTYARGHREEIDSCDNEDVDYGRLSVEHTYGKDNLIWFHNEVWVRDSKGQELPWYIREQDRMANRLSPVWEKEQFWKHFNDIHTYHFVHVSDKDPRLLAYTQDWDKGQRDIQTPIKPGRYLSLYFSEVMSPKKIKWLASWQASGRRPEDGIGQVVIKFANTPEEIVDVYLRGPRSCMDGENFKETENHPVKVYGAGDLAIAYVENGDKVMARCLVWPEKKIAGRVYPTPDRWEDDGYTSWHESVDAQDSLTYGLRRLGYTIASEEKVSFVGARLLKIDRHGGWSMPYLDGMYGVIDKGAHFVMAEIQVSEWRCQVTCGYVGSQVYAICERCDAEIRDSSGSHTVCMEIIDDGLNNQQEWCSDCKNTCSFHCYGYHDQCSNGIPHTAVDEHTYCDDWLQDNAVWSDRSNKWWISGWYKKSQKVEMNNGQIWAAKEFEDFGFTCPVMGHKLPIEDQHPDFPGFSKEVTKDQVEAYGALQRDSETVEEVISTATHVRNYSWLNTDDTVASPVSYSEIISMRDMLYRTEQEVPLLTVTISPTGRIRR
jgi:hypothetical protein